jgi:hypothetical protein
VKLVKCGGGSSSVTVFYSTHGRGHRVFKVWSAMLKERRCIIPAGSFFEGKKQHQNRNPNTGSQSKGGVCSVWLEWQLWLNPKTKNSLDAEKTEETAVPPQQGLFD